MKNFTLLLKEHLNGNNYIILAIDHLTKFAVGAATKSFDAVTTAQFLFNEVVCKLGTPERFLSDQGSNFESNLLKHLCVLLGTDKSHSSTYHAQGNGTTERLNKTLKPSVAKYVNLKHDDWDTYLQMCISAYNNSSHSSIGMSPFEALFNRPPVLVADVILNNSFSENTKSRDISDFTKSLKARALEIAEMLKLNAQIAKNKQKLQFDKQVKHKATFKVGDLVKVNNCRKEIGLSKAFTPKFLGPFRIVKQFNDVYCLLFINSHLLFVQRTERSFVEFEFFITSLNFKVIKWYTFCNLFSLSNHAHF